MSDLSSGDIDKLAEENPLFFNDLQTSYGEAI